MPVQAGPVQLGSAQPAPQAGHWLPASGGFFNHIGDRPPAKMSNATRYLCAAAYEDPVYTNTVIRQLITTHRGVAPSQGIDLDPIMRNCLRARKMRLIRDTLFVVLLLAGLRLVPFQTEVFLMICYFVGFLPSVDWARKSHGFKIFALVGSVLLGLNLLGELFLILLAPVIDAIAKGLSSGSGDVGSTLQQQLNLTSPATLVVLGGIVAVQLVFWYLVARTQCDELSFSGTPKSLAPHPNAKVEARRNPFDELSRAGFSASADTGRAWSIAIELLRENSGRGLIPGLSNSQGYVAIDPVELHQAIRDRLLLLNDEALPGNERLSGLALDDLIVGPGYQRWDSPVLDLRLGVPYSWASPDAIHALIRQPQAGLRYYQRFSVRDESQPVWASRGKVIDGWDHGVITSAFIYVAVEGRMLYVEFVAAVMPPVDPRYSFIDALPKLSQGAFAFRVVRHSLRQLFEDVFYSPGRLAKSLNTRLGHWRGYRAETNAPKQVAIGDLGALISVRELGAAPRLGTYIQELDVTKYTKLAERMITDTVLDFLADKGVDISAYAQSAGAVINNSGVIGKNVSVSGTLAFGNASVKSN
ncbi:MAG TPA: hypothetical protein VGM14_01420 [Streptosporangiaceae bacterium]